jgi:putative spermidine/putrescine transport system ATP-binding protein
MMLAGFEPVSAGSIRLDGRPIEALPAHRRNMGVVFQSYSLFPHMTVAGNVAFPLQMRKQPAARIEEHVARALDRVRLSAFAQRRPNQLSGGQQQRVALARALVCEPSLVLMDEPLAALDKKLREEMQLEIRRLHREHGVTMVYVTHDQSEAMTLSDAWPCSTAGASSKWARRPSCTTGRAALSLPVSSATTTRWWGGWRRSMCGPGMRRSRCRASPPVHARLSERRAAAPALASEATLCIRPERLRVTALSLPAQPWPWAAKVVDLIHQGDHRRLIAELEGAATPAPWVVKLSPGPVPAGLAPGSGVGLAFAAEDAWVSEGAAARGAAPSSPTRHGTGLYLGMRRVQQRGRSALGSPPG